MNFNFEDDEGEFGGGPGGSKLSSLFGMDKATNQGGNESLTFTAPKQPKKGGKGADSPLGQSKSSLLLAVAVHAYRFNNGTYIKHGKLGAAILGNHSSNDYKILLYISKMQQVTHVRLSPQFLFTIQANNYATFYDEQRQNWSIMFESEQNAVDFAKQVSLAKLNSASGVTNSVIEQDLMMGKGDAVVTGDSVEVKYTGWLYQSKMFGDVFDSNANVDKPFRFKIGKGKVIKGWEEGVLGMKKGGRRLLIIPPSHGYGKKGLSTRIPPNATLIFDIEIKKIKATREKDDLGSVSSDAAEVTKSSDERGPSPSPNLIKNGPGIPRTEDLSSKSDHEPMSPTTSSKAKLISRMAKMGQPMLPMAGATVATDNSTDSEADLHKDVTGAPSKSSNDQLERQLSAANIPEKDWGDIATDRGFWGARTRQGTETSETARTAAAKDKRSQRNTSAAQSSPVQGFSCSEASASSDTGFPAVHSTLPPSRKPVKAPRKNIPSPTPPVPQHQHHQPQPQMNNTGHHQLAIYQSQQQLQAGQQPPMVVNQPPMQQFPQQPVQGNMMYGQQQQPIISQAPMGQPMGYQQMPPGSAYPGALIQSQATDVSSSLVLSEARQHHLDLRQTVIQVSDKLNHISQKMDSLQTSQMHASVLSSVPNMEANILMQNIQRIMQENERLKKEVYEKGSKIETQNDKISELLQRNQMFVEESNTLLEKRNDTYKQTATQSQLRVLELEQEKVKLTTDLSDTTAKLSKLQLELGQVQLKETDLRSKLSTTVAATEDQQGEVDLLKVQCREAERKLETVSRTLKDEKLLKKQLETKLGNLEEEMSDLKTEKDAVEKNLADRRKKAASEKQRAQDELDEMKRSYEEELGSLKSRLRQQKTSTDAATAEQVAQIEKELEVQFKERSERIISQAKDTYQREIGDLTEEKEQLARKLATTEQKMFSLRSTQGDSTEQLDELRNKLEETQGWKEKYDALHTSALSMKEKYEKRIVELMQEKSSPEPESSAANVVDEVKKVMNNVYHSLKGEFDSSQSYKGSEILGTIMSTIKVTTIRLVQQQQSSVDEQEDSDESEEEEEDEDTEEEQVAVEEEAPLRSSAAPLQSSAPPQQPTPPPQERENIPDLPEVDQSSQEGGSQQGDTEEKAEGDGDWEEGHHQEEIHDENPESDVSVEHTASEGMTPPSDPLANIPDLPEPSSETVEADSQPFHEDTPQLGEEDSKTEDSQGDDPTAEGDEQTGGEQQESSDMPEGESRMDDLPEGEVKTDDLTEDSETKADELTEDSKVENDDSTEDSKLNVEADPQRDPSGDTEEHQDQSPGPEGDTVTSSGESRTEDSQPAERESSPITTEREDEEVEGEQAEKAADPLSVPILTREPPDAPPEQPPDFPNDEDEEPEEDRKRGGLFGNDSDDEDFFDAVPPAKKTPQTRASSSSPQEDEESLKPKPPPPLFGDSDDDDLDWMN